MPDVVHKFVRDAYYKRFPELESLVHLPLEYVKTVKVCIVPILCFSSIFLDLVTDSAIKFFF